MNEIVKRLTPTKDTLIRLFAKSGNKCAFEGCNHKLFAENGTFIAETCHIEAALPGGERFNENMTNEQRSKESNLILLCHEHHKVTDNVEEYTVTKLKKIKNKHELKYMTGTNSFSLTEEQYQTIVIKYENEINHLYEITTKLAHFRKPEKEFKAKVSYRPSIQQFEDNLNYFDTDDHKIITKFSEDMRLRINKIGLLVGLPSSGKTTIALAISRELYKYNYEAFYLELNHNLPLKEIIQELVIINKKESIIIVDDIHRNLSLAFDIYRELVDMPKLSALFISRKLSPDSQKDDNGENLFDEIKLKYELDSKPTISKFIGIINSYKEKHQIDKSIGNITQVIKFANQNILKLNLMLEFWRSSNEIRLDEFTQNRINREMFIRYLRNVEGEIEDIIPYCCLNSYGIDFHFFNDRSLCEKLQESGLIYEVDEINKLFSFGHSQFAELILEAIIAKIPALNYSKYQSQKEEIKTLQIKKYFENFSNSNKIGYNYPLNTALIFSTLNQQKKHTIIVSLLDDKIILEMVLNYLRNESVEIAAIKDFFKALRFSYSQKYEYLYEKVIEAKTKFKHLIIGNKDGFQYLAYFLISCYKLNYSKLASRTISMFSSDEMRFLIKNSHANYVSFTTRILKNYNPPFCKFIIESLTDYEWAYYLMESPAFITTNSLTELKKINSVKARSIFLLIDEDKLGNNLKELKFYHFEKAISELKEIDIDKARKLLEYYTDEKILKELKHCKISQIGKGLASLYLVNKTRVLNLYLKLNTVKLAESLKQEKVKNAGRIIVELSKISHVKTSDIFMVYLRYFSLSNIKDIGDYLALIYLLQGFGDENDKKILSKFSEEKILQLFKNATPAVCSSGLIAINQFNKDYAKSIFHKIEIDLNRKDIRFTTIGNILAQLKSIDKIRCKELLKNCDKNALVSKALASDINFNQIIQTVEVIANIDFAQANEIFSKISIEAPYANKIYKASFDQLLSNIVMIHKINPVIAKQTITKYISDHKNYLQGQNISFLNLAQGLGRMSTFNKTLCEEILVMFYKKLEEQLTVLEFHEIATGLCEIAKFSKNKAKELLDSCSSELLVGKAKNLTATTINCALGEIGKFDNQRTNEIRKKLGL